MGHLPSPALYSRSAARGRLTNRRTHARARTDTHAHARTRTDTHAHARTRMHGHARTHARTRTQTHARTCTHRHARTCTHTHRHSRTDTHARARTDTHAHARTRTDTHAQTRTHTHTSIGVLSKPLSQAWVSQHIPLPERELLPASSSLSAHRAPSSSHEPWDPLRGQLSNRRAGTGRPWSGPSTASALL